MENINSINNNVGIYYIIFELYYSSLKVVIKYYKISF